jgi:outer membrane putative beta-barrel porin/alpha-amylase
MPTRFRLVLALALLLWIVPLTARAQQPFVTDDADVTPKGKFHVEFSNEHDLLQRSAFPARRQNTADFELDYGLFENVEIGIEAPLITIVNARGIAPTVFGVGDTNLSFKYNFLKEREGSRRPALALTFNVELPTGDPDRSLGSGLTDFNLNGILQKSLNEKTKLRANGGIIFAGNAATGVVGIETRGTAYTGAASLVRQFTSKLDLGVEVFGALSSRSELGRGQLQFQAGGNYAVRPNFTFDFGVTGGRFDASPRLGLQLGFSDDF